MPEQRTRLATFLARFGLDRSACLAAALGCSRQYAHQLLQGKRFGLRIAQRLGKATGTPWHVVADLQPPPPKRVDRAAPPPS